MITIMHWWWLQWWRWGWGVLRPRSGRIYAATGLPLPMPALPHHVMFRHNHRHSHRHQTCRHSHNCKLSLHFFIILLTLSYIIASYQLDTSSYCTDVSYLQCKWKLISETPNFPPLSKAERLHYHPKNYRNRLQTLLPSQRKTWSLHALMKIAQFKCRNNFCTVMLISAFSALNSPS